MPSSLNFLALNAPDVTSLLAYVDPGTGSYVLQVLLAGALAGLFSLKLFWRRIVARIQIFRSGKQAE